MWDKDNIAVLFKLELIVVAIVLDMAVTAVVEQPLQVVLLYPHLIYLKLQCWWQYEHMELVLFLYTTAISSYCMLSLVVQFKVV